MGISVGVRQFVVAAVAAFFGVTGAAGGVSASEEFKPGEIVAYYDAQYGADTGVVRIGPEVALPFILDDCAVTAGCDFVSFNEAQDYAPPAEHGTSIAIASKSSILATGWYGKIVELDVVSGISSTFASGDLLNQPYAIAIEANRDVVVLDGGAIIRIDRDTKVQSTVAQGGHLNDTLPTTSIAVGSDGGIYFLKATETTLVRVDPMTQAQDIVSAGGAYSGWVEGLERSRMFPTELISVTGHVPGESARLERMGVSTTPATRQTIASSSDLFLFHSVHDIAVDSDDSVVTASASLGYLGRLDTQSNAELITAFPPGWLMAVEIVAPACNDGIDNDGDALVDLADPGCKNNPLRDSEKMPPCSSSIAGINGELVIPALMLLFVFRAFARRQARLA